MTQRSVLVADDDPDFRELMRDVLESFGVPVLEAADFTQSVEVATRARDLLGLVLLDYFMPGAREDAVAALCAMIGKERVVLCTACANAGGRASELGLTQFLSKPVDLDTVEALAKGRRLGR